MQIINSIIKAVADAGLRDAFYTGWNNFALIAAGIFCLCYSKKWNIGWMKAWLIYMITTVFLGAFSAVILWAETGFQVYGRQNVVVAFAYIPIVAYLAAKIFRLPVGKICDFVASIPMILHGFYRIGCTFAGCCHGYQSTWGIYNSYMDQIQIPVQLMESLTAFLILGYLVYRNKKTGYAGDGRSIPIMLVLYGSVRFLLEFLHDEAKLFLGCTAMSLHCLFMCAAGIAVLMIIRRKESKATSPVTAKP